MVSDVALIGSSTAGGGMVTDALDDEADECQRASPTAATARRVPRIPFSHRLRTAVTSLLIVALDDIGYSLQSRGAVGQTDCNPRTDEEGRLDARVPFVAAILPEAAATATDPGKALHEFDPHDVLGHL